MDISKRLISLDAFRGFTIAAMILVNNPGSWNHVYPPLLHAEWNGITPTDIIFPFFLFIVGVSIALAYSKRITAGADKKSLYSKILFRSLKIFMVGLSLNFIHHFSFAELRITGVLQRIAIVFLTCGILFLISSWKTQLAIGGGFLLLYWIAMMFISTPGYGKPILEPGTNMAAWIDSYLLPGKMWEGTWDPEGVFSTIPAISTGILGMLFGKFITSIKSGATKVTWMVVIGFVLTISGYIWGRVFPINKNLWTSSYVLFTGGLATMALAASIFFVDMLNYKKAARVGIIFGANAITIYVSAVILSYPFYMLDIGGNSMNGHFMSLFETAGLSLKLGSFLYAFLYIVINYIPAYLLYKKKIFIKL